MKRPQAIQQSNKEGEDIQLLRLGSKNAFEEIFKTYWKDMYKHAYSKLHSKEAAEEIVQDIFATLWLKREVLLITNLQFYLHTSVKNKVLKYVRSQIVHQKYWEYCKKQLFGESAVTEETVYYNDLKLALEKGASFLNKKARIIFQLNRIEGYTASEISKKLNLSEKVVEYHLARSVKELKMRLKHFSPQ